MSAPMSPSRLAALREYAALCDSGVLRKLFQEMLDEIDRLRGDPILPDVTYVGPVPGVSPEGRIFFPGTVIGSSGSVVGTTSVWASPKAPAADLPAIDEPCPLCGRAAP